MANSESTVLCDGEEKKNDMTHRESGLINGLNEKTMAVMNVDVWDQETARDVERMVILRVSKKTHQFVDPPAWNEEERNL